MIASGITKIRHDTETATTRAAVGIIIELNRQVADLETELATHFEAHSDADIYLSLPGLGVILGAAGSGRKPDYSFPHSFRLRVR